MRGQGKDESGRMKDEVFILHPSAFILSSTPQGFNSKAQGRRSSGAPWVTSPPITPTPKGLNSGHPIYEGSRRFSKINPIASRKLASASSRIRP